MVGPRVVISLKPHISGSSQILRTCPSSSGGSDGTSGRYRAAGIPAPVVVVAAAAAAYFADFVLAANFASLSFALLALLLAALFWESFLVLAREAFVSSMRRCRSTIGPSQCRRH
jgi:hypothetical protein